MTCAYCGHVRGLHGRNHSCISAFADGVAGKPCGCPGYVAPAASTCTDCGEPSEVTGCWNDYGEHCTPCHVAECASCQDDLADQDAAEARSDGVHT